MSLLSGWIDEIDSGIARSLLQTSGFLIAPGHVLGEVGHVLVMRFREEKVSEEQLSHARVAVPGTLLLISLDELFDIATEIAIATRQSFYDALYIATAVRWDTVVVTADQKMKRAVKNTDWDHHVVTLHDWHAAEIT